MEVKMDKYIDKVLDRRYKMLEIIGSGGMAVVYKALCQKLNRYVAVKILKDEFLNDDDLRRKFHTESEAVALLSHPNIVSVYDVSSSPNMEYFVMELIDGITLKQYMQQRGVLSPKEAVHFILLILSAIEHAHSKNVIHRDIKPQNIMILRDGTLKVTDFGIARLGTEQNTLTPNTFGSVHYISPEQARGESIDGRTDIYSVGVILYEMLTGKLPYVGDSPVSVAIQHLNSDPVPLRNLNPDIPEALETITLKAMCGDREFRYSDAKSMIDDLESFQKDPNVLIPFTRPSYTNEDEQTLKMPKLKNLRGTTAMAQRAAAAPARKTTDPKRSDVDRRYNGNEDDREYRRYRGIGTGPLLAAVLALVLLVIGMYAVYRVILDPAGVSGGLDVGAPPLVGKSLDDIRSNPDYALFLIKESGSEFNDEYEEGVVISQDPEFGETMKANGVINVVLSRGAKAFTMLDLVNLEYRQAEIALNRLSDTFIIRKEYDKSDKIIDGNIISTKPATGGVLREGEIITLVISFGTELQTIDMPKIIGLTEQAAKKLLAENKLEVGLVNGVESNESPGTVVSQSVTPDSKVKETTVIDFEVSIGLASGTELPVDPTDPVDPADPSVPTDPTPPDGMATRMLPISLPTSPSVFIVKVVEDGKNTVYQKQHTPSDKSIVVTLTSKGSHIYTVYIDGVFKGDQVINFED